MQCTILAAYDGDTVKCDGVSLRPMDPGAPYVSGFDTPEINQHVRCQEEHELGIAARDQMRELIRAPLPVPQVEWEQSVSPFVFRECTPCARCSHSRAAQVHDHRCLALLVAHREHNPQTAMELVSIAFDAPIDIELRSIFRIDQPSATALVEKLNDALAV